ncbi:PREDICTED: uncharacterized protein LOC107112015 isoform X1 [Gekko japonicus]|uniref:Uncharacterized protein LOC107112015 isoform X1 n=1 Tax=Gekko japonicus TaxID=146911 RepID=A0ABM1K4C1_GEKJA|nr:PREDICTED: uncharacterized protein LOC107112015 isoform X1 [Gekko japonicus]
MALLIQELFLVAADLMFASVLSCVFYAVGCLVVPGLIGYVVLLSCGPGAVKKAKRNISKRKEAVLSRTSNSWAGQAVGKILALVGLRGTAPGPSELEPVQEEEGAWNLNVNQLPAGEKKCQKVVKTLTGGRLSGTGTSCGMKRRSGTIWNKEREASEAEEPKAPVDQKEVSTIPAFLLSLLFAPSDWCLKKRHVQRLTALLATLKKSRD